MPSTACSPLSPAPPAHPGQHSFALIARYGGCDFQDKVRAAQAANFSAAVVHNVRSDKLVPMGGDDETAIPSIFIGSSDAQVILAHFAQPKHPQYAFVLTDDSDFDLSAYLLPFIIVAGICMGVMLLVVCFKCVQDHRRKRRHRLPRSALKRLPVVKWKQGDPYECCCVCLEDYSEGDKLRVLPCDHAYHAKCIDPWLVKNKRICPQCRKRVFGGAGDSDSSDSDDRDESAPLLRGARNRQYGEESSSAAGPSLAQRWGEVPFGNTTTFCVVRRFDIQIVFHRLADSSAAALSESAPAVGVSSVSPSSSSSPDRRSRRRRRQRQQQQQEESPGVTLQEDEDEDDRRPLLRGGVVNRVEADVHVNILPAEEEELEQQNAGTTFSQFGFVCIT